MDGWIRSLCAWMDGWMDDKNIIGCMDGWRNKWVDEMIIGCMDGWMDEKIIRCMDGQVDG